MGSGIGLELLDRSADVLRNGSPGFAYYAYPGECHFTLLPVQEPLLG